MEREILQRLDLAHEAQELGFRAAGPETDRGWLEGHSPFRQDANPSAAICVRSANGELGRFTDLGTGEDSLSWWEFAARLAPALFSDWRAAREYYARKVGVSLPAAREREKCTSPPAGPKMTHLRLHDLPPGANQILVRQWAEVKPGVDLSAALSAGAKSADFCGASVIALPGYRAGQVAAWELYRRDGQPFIATKKLPERKKHSMAGSVISLGVVGPWPNLVAADKVAVCEGAPDALAAAQGLARAGWMTTWSTGGASKFPDECSQDLAGKEVLIIHDADQAGVEWSHRAARRLLAHGCRVRIAALPYPVAEKHGKDLRDYVCDGGDPAQLAAEAREVTAEDLPADKTPKRATGAISNYDEAETSEGGSVKVPRSMKAILGQIRAKTDNWPRCVGGSLFAPAAGDRIDFFPKTADFFGYLNFFDPVFWSTGGDYVSKAECFAEYRRTATRYDAVETLPHEPPVPGAYYIHSAPEPGDGKTLQAFVDRFCPADPLDRTLILAAAVTPLAGLPGGYRPAFLIDADAGRGVGKSTLANMIGAIYGGTIGISPKDDFEKVRSRLLSNAAYSLRVALVDNVKSHRLSWPELEGLVTATSISGWRIYEGQAERPNLLTWFITLNSACLGTDISQRSVIVKLRRPNHTGTWAEDTRSFISRNREKLIADGIACLRGEGVSLPRYSRWATWEKAVLAKLDDAAAAQELIASRQQDADIEDEESEAISQQFHRQLTRLRYDADREAIFVPSDIAANWVNWALGGEKNRTSAASRMLSQMVGEGRLPQLAKFDRWKNKVGRGFLWAGVHMENLREGEIFCDLRDRIASRGTVRTDQW